MPSSVCGSSTLPSADLIDQRGVWELEQVVDILEIAHGRVGEILGKELIGDIGGVVAIGGMVQQLAAVCPLVQVGEALLLQNALGVLPKAIARHEADEIILVKPHLQLTLSGSCSEVPIAEAVAGSQPRLHVAPRGYWTQAALERLSDSQGP
eukprot:UN1093